MRGTVRERFFAKVMQPAYGSACWTWIGGKDNHNYGVFQVAVGDIDRAHRAAWRLFRGEIPDGLWVLHKCDSPSCVNPDHLFIGTNADNVADKMRKGRHAEGNKTHCKRGHSLAADNVYSVQSPRGTRRMCKECLRVRGRVYDAVRRRRGD